VLARQAPTALEASAKIAGVVHQRIAFAEASAVGESVVTTDPHGALALEITRLWRAVRHMAEAA
jgi:hypothetical protein